LQKKLAQKDISLILLHACLEITHAKLAPKQGNDQFEKITCTLMPLPKNESFAVQVNIWMLLQETEETATVIATNFVHINRFDSNAAMTRFWNWTL
jgi:hypothetical protein